MVLTNTFRTTYQEILRPRQLSTKARFDNLTHEMRDIRQLVERLDKPGGSHRDLVLERLRIIRPSVTKACCPSGECYTAEPHFITSPLLPWTSPL